MAWCCEENKRVHEEIIEGPKHNILQGIRPLNKKLQIPKIKHKGRKSKAI